MSWCPTQSLGIPCLQKRFLRWRIFLHFYTSTSTILLIPPQNTGLTRSTTISVEAINSAGSRISQQRIMEPADRAEAMGEQDREVKWTTMHFFFFRSIIFKFFGMFSCVPLTNVCKYWYQRGEWLNDNIRPLRWFILHTSDNTIDHYRSAPDRCTCRHCGNISPDQNKCCNEMPGVCCTVHSTIARLLTLKSCILQD